MDSDLSTQQQASPAAATRRSDESRRPASRNRKRTSWSSRPSITSVSVLPISSASKPLPPAAAQKPPPPSPPAPLPQPLPDLLYEPSPTVTTLSNTKQKRSSRAGRRSSRSNSQTNKDSRTSTPSPTPPTTPKSPKQTRASTPDSKRSISPPKQAPVPEPKPAPTPTPTPAPVTVPVPAERKQQQQPQPPPAQKPAPAPEPETEKPALPPPPRRTLSFRLPVRVASENTTSAEATPPAQRRSRAYSLPHDSEPSTPATPSHARSQSSNRRQSQNLNRFSLSSIGELATPRFAPEPQADPVRRVSDTSESNSSTNSPAEQFLLDRGLPIDVPLGKVPSPLIYQSILESQLNNYLATMSAQAAKTPDVATAQQYQQTPPNMNMRMQMPSNALVQPALPGLSGTANGPVGNLLRGPVSADGKLKDAVLTVGIKLDLEAEVHLTARVRGDILVGLY